MFDEPNLLPHAGLAPLMALADRAGLRKLLAGVRPGGPCGSGAVTKVTCLIAGMAAGADSIDDMDLLRDGAMETAFAGVRARPPSVPACAPIPGATSASPARRTAGSWPPSRGTRGCCPAGTSSRSSTSTPPRTGSTATRRKEPRSATRRSRGSPCCSRA